MVTQRRYYFEHPGAWTDQDAYAVVAEVLRHQCVKNWWYNDPEVAGAPFGRLTFSLTVAGDDQWQTHRRAMGLAVTVYRRLGLPRKDVPVPMWTPLEPHENRGRSRIPREPTEPGLRSAMRGLREDLKNRSG
jgi:hypothetical protein